MRIVISFVLGLALGGNLAPAWASDDCATATPIGSLPFSTTVDTTTATDVLGDPDPSCDGAFSNTVWFTYTASSAVTLLIDTNGSTYPATIAAYTDGCAATAELGCARDHNFDNRTQLLVPVPAGTTVHLYIADAFGGGGTLALSVAKAAVDATPPVSVRAAVSSGQPTPIGGGFSRVTNSVALSRTDVAFTATTEGIFLDDGVNLTTLAMSGDPTPAGGTYSNLGRPAIGAGPTVVFHSTINGGSAAGAIFVHSGGTTTALVKTGDAAPGGGTFGTIISGLAISPNGTLVAFFADTSLNPREALFIASSSGGGVLAANLTELDPSPCGGTITALGNALPEVAINDSGTTAVHYRGTNDGILVGPLSWSALACQGQATPLGGTYRMNRRSLRIANVGGQVAFQSTVTLPGPDTDAVFLGSPGSVSVIAQEGDVAIGGAAILNFASTSVSDVSGADQVTFTARTTGGDAVLTQNTGTPQATVLLSEGQACPTGGVFHVLDTWVDVDPTGAAVIRGACTGNNGIFAIPAGGGAPVTVALQTDTTTAGAGFVFDDPTRAGTDVAFLGLRTAVYQVHCEDAGCDPPTAVVQPLAPAPGLPGEVISTIDPDQIAGQGKLIAFVATTQGTVRRGAVFAVRSGIPELVAAEQTTLPGTMTEIVSIATGTLSLAVPAFVGADKRSIAFVADISDPSDPGASSAIFLARNGVITEIARDTALAPNGETYFEFGAPFVKGSKVFFSSETNGGTSCVILAVGSVETALTCTGDVLTIPLAATITLFEADVPALASRGPVIRAALDQPDVDECLLATSTSDPTAVICAEDPLPYGSVVDELNGLRIAAARRRFASYVSDYDFTNAGLFAFSRRTRARIAGDGQPTPVGGTYSVFDARPSLYGKTVAFLGDVSASGSTTRQALFVAVLKK